MTDAISIFSKFRCLFLLLLSFIASCTQNTDDEWIALFNGKDLSGWNYYLSRPDSSFTIPGYEKDSLGHFISPLKDKDPLKVFSVVNLKGVPVLRISGQVIGNLYTLEKHSNYHLKLQFKWGDKKWKWMKGRPKDGGILYHYTKKGNNPGIRHEFQIHAGDVGSYWAKNTMFDVPSYQSKNLPQSILKAKEFLQPLVPTLRDTMLVFHRDSSIHIFEGKNEWQICLANPQNENKRGEWNTLEIICYENHSIHIVNAQINMIILNAHYKQNGQIHKMTEGSIQLQSEGAVIFFKDIKIKPVTELPSLLQDYL